MKLLLISARLVRCRIRPQAAAAYVAALASSLFMLPGHATAFVLANGEQINCTVQTALGPYTVPEQSGFANGFAGFTSFGPNGLPIITFDPSRIWPIAQQLPIAVEFLFYHECAHARFGTRFTSPQQSELGANCEGLRKMRNDGKITPAQEMEVGQYHSINNVYANLFGNGAAYWQMTLACAAQAPAFAESVYGSGPVIGGPAGALGPFCCTFQGVKVGPFPPPHIPVGAPCHAPVMGNMVPGQACQ
jgi:hypothetical protein